MTVLDHLREMEATFLREIEHDPHDETAVLVYSDWLTDQDDPALVSRGEFLRLESILKRGRPGAQRSDLEWQARQLWWDHVEDWLGPLYHAVDHFLYERGLLSIEVSAPGLAEMDPEELAAIPAWDWVRHIGVRKGGLTTLELLSERPRPVFLVSIDVGRRTIHEEPDLELSLVLGLPIVGGLKELDLSENVLNDAACSELAHWQDAGSIRKLSLRKSRIDDDGLRTLLASPFLGGLEELDLSYNLLSDVGARELIETASLPRLSRLDLRYNAFDWHSVAALQKRFGDGVETYPARQHSPYLSW
jgi:uncharacterized protein (TIGR02996 family)